jgi:FkbM family methyltransferase
MIQRTNKKALIRAQHELGTVFPDYAAYVHDLCMLRALRSMGFEPDTVYDIGSSDGIWSYVASWVFPQARFELFDPLVFEAKYVNSRAGHRGLKRFADSSKVRVHDKCFGRVDAADGNLAVFPDLVGSTTLPLDHTPAEVESRKIPCVRLDSYAEKEGLPKPDLIKLDTRGSELEILQGAERLLPSATAILCECWLFPGYGKATPLWLEVANFLRDHNFDIFDFGWVYRRPSDQRPATVDILFLRRSTEFSPLRPYVESR